MLLTEEEIQESINRSREKYRKRFEEWRVRSKEEKELLKLFRERIFAICSFYIGNGRHRRKVTCCFGEPGQPVYNRVGISTYVTVLNPNDRDDLREVKLLVARRLEENVVGDIHTFIHKRFLEQKNYLQHLTNFAKAEVIQLALYDGKAFMPKPLCRAALSEELKHEGQGRAYKKSNKES